MEPALAPGDIARVVFGAGSQDHVIKVIDGNNIYISANPDGDDYSLLVPRADGSYYVQGLNILHTVEFIVPNQDIALTGIPFADLQILQRLDDDSLKAACMINRYVAGLCQNEDLWKNKLTQKYGARALGNKPEFLDYRQYYVSFDQKQTIAAGDGHTIVLDEKGNVYTFGLNMGGQLARPVSHRELFPGIASLLSDPGLPPNEIGRVKFPTRSLHPGGPAPHRVIPARRPHPAPPIQSVASGNMFSIFVTTTGRGYIFGDNRIDQLGSTLENAIKRGSVYVSNIHSAAAGWGHVVLLDTKGNVHTFGTNANGQLGIGLSDGNPDPQELKGIPRIRRVAAGQNHTVLVTVYGGVYTFGDDRISRLGPGGSEHPGIYPTLLTTLPPIRDVACGVEHTVLITYNGDVYVFGNNQHGQLGLGNTEERNVPTLVPGLPTIRSAACGDHTILVTFRGGVYTFGNNKYGQLGLGDNKNRNVPTPILDLPPIRSAAAGTSHTLLVAFNGDVYSFGFGRDGQLGLGTTNNRYVPTLIPNLVASV